MRAEVLVVGSGIAALSVALAAAPRRVLVLTPGRLALDGSSHWAQGGIAAAIGTGDSTAAHAADTLAAGAGWNDLEQVQALAEAAPDTIRWLLELGAHFDLDAQGRPRLGREAAHGAARIVHAQGDATGAELMRALAAAVRRSAHIEVLEGFEARALAAAGSRVGGVLAEGPGGRRFLFAAGAVVLATGGIGQIYRHTTNPGQADGRGLGMALALGAHCRDLEFVQFHPTALAVQDPGGGPGLPLLTEALRGAGATLIDSEGRRFMAGVAGAELAPRDVVARAVYRQLQRGPAFLDARTAVGDDFPQRFPSVFALAMARGLDPRRQPLPVAPAVHYHMGGIAVDAEGRSSLAGLYAVGEVACTGVHGANRLASNSLLEGLVFGRRCGRALRDITPGSGGALRAGHVPPEAADPARGLPALRELMWRHAGIERDAAGLAAGLATLEPLLRAETAGTRQWLRLLAARAILQAASARRHSLGAHFLLEAAVAA